MKKTKIILMIAASVVLISIPLETMASNNSTELTTIGGKRKGYKPKRGGLFNTGLFRKKNACGCPNH